MFNQNDGQLLLLKPMHCRNFTWKILHYFRSILFSFDSSLLLGIWTASVAALFAHKCAIILLHTPLPTFSLICFAPFLFVFDIIVVLLLHRGLVSASRSRSIFAGFVCLVIICCSASFLSLYLEGKAELSWGVIVEV
jgi:hypothetical protein